MFQRQDYKYSFSGPTSLESLMTALEALPIGLYVAQRGRFVWVNAQFKRDTGYLEQELVGLDALALVAPEDKGLSRESAIRMLKGELRTPYEFRILTKDGAVRRALGVVCPLEWLPGRFLLGAFLDITAAQENVGRERAHIREMEALAAVTQELTRPGSFIAQLTNALGELANAVQLEQVVFRVPDEAAKGLTLLGAVGWNEFRYLLPYGEGLAGLAYAQGSEMVVQDYVSFPGATPEALGTGARSVMAVPISLEGKRVGVITLMSRHPSHFTPERVWLVTIVAGLVGLLAYYLRR